MIDRRSLLAGLAALSCGVPGAAGARETGWPEGIVSLTYDDGLPCHLDIAAPALARHGLLATFFVSWINIAKRESDWIALGRAGHEIADHSVHHRCDLVRLRPQAYARDDIQPMERWLDIAFGPDRDRDFAYPCDVTNLGPGSPNFQQRQYIKLLKTTGLRSARTSEGKPNRPEWVRRAPFRLQALAVGYDAVTVNEVLEYLRIAKAEKRWAILVFHRLLTEGSADGSVTASDHEAILDAVVQTGMPCRTIGAAIRRGAG